MEASAVDALAVPAVASIPMGVVDHPDRAARPASAIHDTPAPGMAISTASRAVSRQPRTAVPCRDRDDRRGIIAINMAGGTTLRVDTTVDDQALRRVLTVTDTSEPRDFRIDFCWQVPAAASSNRGLLE
jgi:hypothetical protein